MSVIGSSLSHKQGRAQAEYQKAKKARQDVADVNVSDIDLGDASSASESDENYFKDNQRFQFDDGVEEILPITNDDEEDSDQKSEAESDDDEKGDGESDDQKSEDSGDLKSEDAAADFEHEALEDDSLGSEDEYDDHLEAWGNKKKNFFSTDFVDQDRGISYRDEDLEKADAVVKMSKAIHENFLNNEFDQGLTYCSYDDEYTKVKNLRTDVRLDEPDWKACNKAKEHKVRPEFISTVHSFKDKLLDLKNRMLPLMKHLKKMKALDDSYSAYVLLKTQVLLIYGMNASFYMSLKSQNIPVTGHPVLTKLAKYEKILNRLQVLDVKLNPMIDGMLKNVEKSDAISQALSGIFSNENKTAPPASKKKTPESVVENGKGVAKSKDKKKVHFETEVEKEVLSGYMEMKEQERKSSTPLDLDQLNDGESEEMDNEENADGDDLNAKRSISYQIAKNKGLIPHRKKEYRNPRVRHRMKFKKAQIRRKGQVRLPRKELKKYSGELSGISSHVTKSIKIK